MPSLVILFLRRTGAFEEVLSAWHTAGAPEVTILDCVGTRGAKEKARSADLPMLPTIRDLLQSDDAPRKAILAVVAEETVDALIRVTEETVGDLETEGNGILLTVPVGRVVGLRAPPA